MIGIDFSNGSLTYLLELILGPGPIWGMRYGPSKSKKCILGKSKMAASGHRVHQRKKSRKQKSLVSMSYNWSVPKFLPSDQNLVRWSQKTDFILFRTS